jgi:hypothetical protein
MVTDPVDRGRIGEMLIENIAPVALRMTPHGRMDVGKIWASKSVSAPTPVRKVSIDWNRGTP